MNAVRLLWLAAAINAFYLLVAGAQVNAFQAALSVPDWPLSYGRILASEWPGNVFYEQHHRANAATTLIFFLAGAIALRRRRDLTRARRTAPYAAAALVVQILLGGVIVLKLNPPWIGVIHVTLALVTTVLIASVAILVWRPESAAPRDLGAGLGEATARKRVKVALALVLFQVLLGSLARHPPAGESFFVASLLAHVLLGLVVVGWLLWTAVSLCRRANSKPLRTWGWLLLAGTLLQLLVAAWVLVVSPEPLAEAWPPPRGFPIAHAAHIVLAGWIGTCLTAVLLRSAPRRELGPSPAA